MGSNRILATRCVAAGMILAALSSGCVHRRLTIRTDPPGALVMVDGEELGYSPVSVDFTYYATREIRLIKDGYETKTVLQKVPTPLYEYPGLDFFSENFAFHKIRNRHEFTYQLTPQELVTLPELKGRAESLRTEAIVAPSEIGEGP